MKVEELVDELRKNVLRDISDAESVDQNDYLWDDPTLLRYINEAYFRFCRRTLYLQDATTPEVVEVPLVAGQDVYELHRSVLEILSVQYGDFVLRVIPMQAYFGNRPQIGTVEAHHVDYDGAPVLSVVPDYEVGQLKVVGTPRDRDDGKTLNLRVCRLPLKELSFEEPDNETELPSYWMMDVLEWAAYRCLRNHDADGENMQKANSHRNRFNVAVEEAIDEYRSRTFSPAAFAPTWRW